MKPTSISPANVSGGMRAFLKACFHMIVPDPTPLARASFTNSESSTSSIDERTSRISPADASHPSVMAGIGKYVRRSKKLVASWPARAGRQPVERYGEYEYQHYAEPEGAAAACPNSAKVLPMTSQIVPRLTADNIPNGMPVISTNSTADNPS